MNNPLIKVIRILLDSLDRKDDTGERLAALEKWQSQMEEQWKEVINNGSD